MVIALVLTLIGAMMVAMAALALLMPAFRAYAQARPNARSSHRVPVPQGGGIGILIGGLGIGLLMASLSDLSPPASATLLASALGMGVLGAWDDLSPLSWRLRFGVQALLIAILLVGLPPDIRLFPGLPVGLERCFALVLGLWFVNLVNFMDGIDGLLVVGTAPLALAIGTGFFGILPPEPFAMAMAGALLGFLAFNRPPARLFAGDVGALAVGLIMAYLLFILAARVSLVAAIILPLHFVADATLTLLLRAGRKKNLTEAHRDHAYQRAFDAGMPNQQILIEVLLLNIILSGLAGLAILHPIAAIPSLMVAFALCAGLIWRQRRWRR